MLLIVSIFLDNRVILIHVILIHVILIHVILIHVNQRDRSARADYGIYTVGNVKRGNVGNRRASSTSTGILALEFSSCRRKHDSRG
jgi:hypothetical protein